MVDQVKDVYKQHGIHVCRLVSGMFAAAVVSLGSQTGGIKTVRGAFRTREDAVEAAKAYIDQQ